MTARPAQVLSAWPLARYTEVQSQVYRMLSSCPALAVRTVWR